MQALLVLAANAALVTSTLVSPSFTYGPQISGVGKDPYSRSYGGNWTKMDKEYGGYAVWFDPSSTGEQKVAWRQGDDHTSVAAFIYNSSIPNALTMTMNEPESMPNNISGFIYTTAELTYPHTSTPRDSRLSKRADAWTGPFEQIKWSLPRYIDVSYDDNCPISPTFTITVTDAAGSTNSTTGGSPRFTIPDTAVYPVSGVITSEPDIGNGTFTFQADQPLTYAIGTGPNAPGVWAYSYIGMYFCSQPDDD